MGCPPKFSLNPLPSVSPHSVRFHVDLERAMTLDPQRAEIGKILKMNLQGEQI